MYRGVGLYNDIQHIEKYRNSILRLIKAVQLVRDTNDFVHTTKLMSIIRLYDWNKSCDDFYLYLLEKSWFHFKNGNSLAKSHIITDQEKTELYGEVLSCVRNFHENRNQGPAKNRLEELYGYFQKLSPGWKRFYIHTGRRTLEEPDLILMEYIISCYLKDSHNGYWAFSLAQFYCCDYKNFRFKMDAQSEGRIMDIVRYFIEKYSFFDLLECL